MVQHIELHSLGQGAALTDGDNITLRQVLEARRAMNRHVGMSLLKSNNKEEKAKSEHKTAKKITIPIGPEHRRDHLIFCHAPSVLRHELQVVSAHHDGSLHLVGDDHALQDAAADRHVPSEGALLVDVVTLDGLLRGLEAQADALVVTHGALLGLDSTGLANEDGILLLVRLLGL